MSEHELRLSRRTFLVVGALAVPAVVVGCDGPSAAPAPGPPTTDLTRPSGQLLDLASRWRHLEPRVTRPGLVAAWGFDEGSGYAFTDLTGHGHDLYITGSRWNTSDSGLRGAIHRAGLRGSSVHLDGSRWLAAEHAPTLQEAATISCWVRLDSLPATTATLVRVGSRARLLVDRRGSLLWSATETAGSARSTRSAADRVKPAEWVHCAVVVEPATSGVAAGSDQIALYVDGEVVGNDRWPHISLDARGEPLVLGEGLSGSLDQTTMHDAALSSPALRKLYAVGLPRVYTQSSETVDANAEVWNAFSGSEPIPHPIDAPTVMTLRFDRTPTADQGQRTRAVNGGESVEERFAPARFGAGWRADGGGSLDYPSPIRGRSGTMEAWYQVLTDPGDPGRQRRKEVFRLTGRSGSALTMFTESGRWQIELTGAGLPIRRLVGAARRFIPGVLEHVAGAWGAQPGGEQAVVLFVNGVEAGRVPVAEDLLLDGRLEIGGPTDSPAFCLIDDVRLSSSARGWGSLCPRGQSATEAAGLDLRDTLHRPEGSTPLWWRMGSKSDGAWTFLERGWVDPALTGDDPANRLALYQPDRSGRHTLYHPDASGHASSVEAAVSFPNLVDGWAGVFVRASAPDLPFSGTGFTINPARGLLRIAHYDGGRLTEPKVLGYDFPTASRSTYELTLTVAGDGLARGFVDGNNVISSPQSTDAPTEGYAGVFTEDANACFENFHFCALTPPTSASRRVRIRTDEYGDGAGHARLTVTPFRWHKRRGLLPWDYKTKDPEPAGNIAGAATAVPPRPIPAAFWRSEDSANSDLIVVGGSVVYFMRGNPRIDGLAGSGRIGVLLRGVDGFDGIHFHDPNLQRGLEGPTLLQRPTRPGAPPDERVTFQLNSPASAYAGAGQVLLCATEIEALGLPRSRRLVYSYFNVSSGRWQSERPAYVDMAVSGKPATGVLLPGLAGSPEIVSLRDPQTDQYRAVLLHQVSVDGEKRMATTGLLMGVGNAPSPDPGMPTRTSLRRGSGGDIYGFRVMFDNGIYYLHYNEGPHVPDWPSRFVLATSLDPYAGPWVVSPTTAPDSSTYFRRGSELEPDNGAIWQGTMVKHRGEYYLYYENYHSIGDVDTPYQHYNAPQAGSRVGFATA